MSKCIDLVRAEIKDLTEKELDEVLEQMRGRQAVLIQKGADPTTAATQAGMQLAETLRAAAAIEKANALRNRRIRMEAIDYVRTTWADKPAEGIFAILYGSHQARFGSRASVNSMQDALVRKYFPGFEMELRAAGLFDVLARGELDREVFGAMRSLKDEKALQKLPLQAVQIAKILDKWQEVARLDTNRAGAWIGKLDDYGLRQSHDANRISKAGPEKWKADNLPRFDLVRMFPEGIPKDLDKWLDETYHGITTGVRETTTGDRMAAFKGPGNLAKRLSQERVLHFKTADDAFNYNAEYGMGNIRETFVTGLHRMAEATGMMQVLGTNPEYNLNAIVDAVRSDLSRSDPAAYEKFQNATRRGKRIENAYREVSGYTRSIANSNYATAGAVLRALNVVTGLGGAVITAITDVPVRASMLRYQGQNYLQQLSTGLIKPLLRSLDSLDSADKKAVLAAAGYYNEVALGNLAARFSPDETIPGRVSSATNTFFKYNLLAQWTDSLRRATLEAMSHYWGSIASKVWSGLSDRNQRALERFKIGEQEWSVISKGTTEVSGKKFMTPQAVRDLSPDEFLPLAKERINAVKTGLAERVQQRMKRDEREQQWVSDRAEKLQKAILDATAKINTKLAKAEGATAMRLRDLSAALAGLYSKVDASSDYWRNVRQRIPSVSQVASQAVSAERARVSIAATERAQRQAAQELLEVKASKEVAFDEKWDARIKELTQSLAKAGDEAAANARLGQFDDAFAEANAQITEALKSADDATATRLKALDERLKKSQAKMTESLAAIEKARIAEPTAGELRAAGTAEGRALAAAKDIKADARQIARDLEKLKKDLNESFIDKWSERNDDLTAFSEGIAERIKARSEASARDFGNLEPRIDRILEETREQIADRLQQFYSDDLDSAVITPDARTRAFMRQGQQAGTALGEVLRAFWQFKSFGIAIMQRAFMRELYGYGPKFGISQMRGLGLLMICGLSFGYAAMAIKDVLKGKKPRPLDNPRTWLAAMAQGGSMGFYGDFLFGEVNRMGGGIAETLGGPTISKLGDLNRLWGSVKAGDDASAQAFRVALNNVPYNNLFYARAVADYMFLYEVQEAMNPGYLRRMERKAEEERGQEWWLRPSEVAN